MSEVKFKACDLRANAIVVQEVDYDRVTTERDEALARVAELESDEPEWSAIQQKLGDANVELQNRLIEAETLLRGVHTGDLFGSDDWETVNTFLESAKETGIK